MRKGGNCNKRDKSAKTSHVHNFPVSTPFSLVLLFSVNMCYKLQRNLN